MSNLTTGKKKQYKSRTFWDCCGLDFQTQDLWAATSQETLEHKRTSALLYSAYQIILQTVNSYLTYSMVVGLCYS
jgi:hypothetical protein